MYVKRVCADNESYKIINPEWNDIENIILTLDGLSTTEIIMDNGSMENYLCIAGGNHELFILYIYYKSKYYVLINTAFKKRIYCMFVGGELQSYNGRFCNTFDTVLEVTELYFHTGNISDKYIWEIYS